MDTISEFSIIYTNVNGKEKLIVRQPSLKENIKKVDDHTFELAMELAEKENLDINKLDKALDSKDEEKSAAILIIRDLFSRTIESEIHRLQKLSELF